MENRKSNRAILSEIANAVCKSAGRKAAREFVRKMLKSDPYRWEDYAQHSELHAAINERARMLARFEKVQRCGLVGVIVAGMDCDCSKYHYERVEAAPVSMMRWQREENRRLDWLDGPESVYYVDPREVSPANDYSRDLALEAYEDGHPHVVYA